MEKRRARDTQVDRTVEESIVDGVTVKIDPGSKGTGIAIARIDNTATHALSFFDLKHRGESIHIAMQKRANYRRRRRSANLRYRTKRFYNRKRSEKWLPPSIRHRVDTTVNWVKRLQKILPVKKIYFEHVKFDTQKMQNP